MNGPIIVTGAAGFIGRNVVAELNARGRRDLFLVDSLGTDERWKNLLGLEFEEIWSPDQLLTAIDGHRMPRVAALIHLGACSATTERNADFLLENNYRYTCRLAAWAVGSGARLVYASSAATYGDGSEGYDDRGPLQRLRPLNMYGYSKHLFDCWAERKGLAGQIAGIKYFNVYGPFEDHKGDMRSLVNKAYAQIISRGWIELFESDRPDYRHGEQKRDFVYVRDAVSFTLWLAEHRDRNGLFNCGTGEARTWIDLANALFRATGRQPDIRFIPLPAPLKGKYQYFTQAPMAKARAAGFATPFNSLETGVADYVDSYLAAQIAG